MGKKVFVHITNQPKQLLLSLLNRTAGVVRMISSACVNSSSNYLGLVLSSSFVLPQVQLTAVEVESLRSELADLEEREAQLKAQLENIDEILRSARLSGYLYIRTRWAALPGESPPIDDTEVDDWVPRFVVLQGACLFLYLVCTDLSPQDSTLLSDIIEVDQLPSFKREDDEMRYAFYILTRHGLRYECSSSSKIQVDSWLSALKSDCKLESDTATPNGSIDM